MAARAVSVAAGTADAQGISGGDGLRLMGFSVAETASSAAAAEVILRHGTGASDPILAGPINLDANGIGFPPFPTRGVECQNGIYVDRGAGNTILGPYAEERN